MTIKKAQYKATFSDGTTVTRSSHRLYGWAWRRTNMETGRVIEGGFSSNPNPRTRTSPGTKLEVVPVSEPTTVRIRDYRDMACGRCNGSTLHDVDAEYSTGITLPNGYTPTFGEPVKFHSITCKTCGDWQVS